jgi:hypothetical protein
MSEWSIDTELRQATGSDDTATALRSLAVLSPEEALAKIVTKQDWVRGGAESYIYTFEVVSTTGRTVSLIIKAHTPAPGPTSIEKSLSEMLRRRELLRHSGVRTPTLYYAGRGIVIEQYVPFSWVDRFEERLKDPGKVLKLAIEVVVIAMVLDDCGFAPVDVISDLRVDVNEEVYLVDFGQDLGPAWASPNRGENEKRFWLWLERSSLRWTREEIKEKAVVELRRRHENSEGHRM